MGRMLVGDTISALMIILDVVGSWLSVSTAAMRLCVLHVMQQVRMCSLGVPRPPRPGVLPLPPPCPLPAAVLGKGAAAVAVGEIVLLELV